MTKALKWLSTRALTKQELLAKFQRLKEPPASEIAEAIAEDCIRVGFINDTMYASDFANVLANRGCGYHKVKFNLKRRGLSEEDVEHGLSGVSTPKAELERAISAGSYKLRLMRKDETMLKKREKLYRFLATRGFQGDIVRKAMNTLLNQDFEEEF